MSRDYNKCIFTGRLGADPEKRLMPGNNEAVTNFRIAVGEEWKDKQTGEKQERTEWVSFVAFRELANVCAQYLHKGDRVMVDGRMRTRKWQDKTGADRYTTEIVLETLTMLGSPRSREANNAEPQQRRWSSTQAAEPASERFDDEIPF